LDDFVFIACLVIFSKKIVNLKKSLALTKFLIVEGWAVPPNIADFFVDGGQNPPFYEGYCIDYRYNEDHLI